MVQERKERLSSIMKSLQNDWIRKTSYMESVDSQYYPWSAPGNSHKELQKISARRYRLAMWILEQLGASY